MARRGRPSRKQRELQALAANLADQQWRIRHLYRIVNKSGRQELFAPNAAQTQFLTSMVQRGAGSAGNGDAHDSGHTVDVILKARQLGFTTLACILALDECVFWDDQTALIIAHRREDAEKIFSGKIIYAWTNLPNEIREIRKTTHQTQSMLQWAHGSRLYVSTSGRSGSFSRVHISEFGLLCTRYPDKAREVVTGTLPAAGKNPVTIESTADGQAGYFFEFCQMARRGERFNFHFFPWWGDPAYIRRPDYVTVTEAHRLYFERLQKEHGIVLSAEQKAWYVAEEAILGGDMARENPSYPDEAFEQAIEGAFFAQQLAHSDRHGLIGHYPFDPRYPVSTFWDLGRNDLNVIWLHQYVDNRSRMIGYYECSGEHISHYAHWLEEWRKEREARWERHYWPHDGAREDQFLEHGRLGEAEKYGLDPDIVQRPATKIEAIDAARAIFASVDFDEAGCAAGIKRLRMYRKEFDEKREVWKDRPRHDENSHAADAFMTFACGFEPPSHDADAMVQERLARRRRRPGWA